jgi:hypothetical protein
LQLPLPSQADQIYAPNHPADEQLAQFFLR